MTEPALDVALAPEAPPRSRARLWVALRVVLALAGVGAVVLVVRDVGPEAIARVLVPALAWLPLALAFELGRVAADAVASQLTLEPERRVPALPMFAAHLVAFAVMGVAPAGRATAEAVKASLLARWTGGGSAAALGTANQANTLISSGTFSIACLAAAWVTSGASLLTWALLAHVLTLNVCGLAIRAAARYERVGAALTKRFPKLAPHVEAFHATSRATSLFPPGPVLTMMLGRTLQTAHFAVLAAAVGAQPGVVEALALHGVYLVVAAIGVMIPGQLGASEGAFALAAGTLHATVAQATAIALLAHVVQLVLVVTGFVVLALWRSGPRRR